jgi:hypothetical protein
VRGLGDTPALVKTTFQGLDSVSIFRWNLLRLIDFIMEFKLTEDKAEEFLFKHVLENNLVISLRT